MTFRLKTRGEELRGFSLAVSQIRCDKCAPCGSKVPSQRGGSRNSPTSCRGHVMHPGNGPRHGGCCVGAPLSCCMRRGPRSRAMRPEHKESRTNGCQVEIKSRE
ncbi:hypothetical protein C1H46_012798 [Malus baccata]|uniref:Uncharacterized protein n=1 Tax=Malus baccata TaxID=106549 RepID=A0A540MS19_MALBA|nr:hypothetical protein C1H46_012798 [Malus baccata]